MKYTVTPVSDMLVEVRIRYDSVKDSALFLLTSDIHFDSPSCERELFFRHLNEAKAQGAGVFVFGDFLDVMASRNDRRRSKSLLRSEYVNSTYLQSVVMDAAEKLKPYRESLILMSDGNHETAIRTHQEVDLLKWLVHELKRDGSPVLHGGYHGFVRFVFTKEDGGRVRSFLLYYHHGKFGGEVTKGVLGVSRWAAVVPDADAVVTGHVHQRWKVSHEQYKLLANGDVVTRSQHHIKCSTYKQEFAKRGGWAIEKIGLPKPIGGWWMELSPHWESGVEAKFWETK